MSTKKTGLSRRMFLGTAAAAGALTAGCGQSKSNIPAVSKPNVTITKLHDSATDGSLLKAGLIGCGGRGRGAAINYLNAGPNLRVTAIADVFQDRVDAALSTIKEKTNQDTPPENVFVGFDGFQ